MASNVSTGLMEPVDALRTASARSQARPYELIVHDAYHRVLHREQIKDQL
jgi:hypothetical protein